MAYNYKTATIFGGTGFIGRQIVRELANEGYRIKVVCRIPEKAYNLKPCGAVGQIVAVECDYSSLESIVDAVKGSDVVVNCVGTLLDKKKSTFSFVHKEFPELIAKACKKSKAPILIHLSALGVDKSKSKYAISKRDGEKAVLKSYKSAVILRPSIVFGPNDNFFNLFARFSIYLPFLPLIGGGHTKFQPVYVGDVADSVMSIIRSSQGGLVDHQGQIYELGGPEVLSFKELFDLMFYYTKRPRALVNLSFGFAKLQAFFFELLLPSPPLTRDQVESLKTDSIVGKKAKGLVELGVQPTSLSMILPTYLERYCPGGRYDEKKRA